MKNQVTFGHLLTVLIGIIIPIFIWAKNVDEQQTIAKKERELNKNEIVFLKETQKEDKKQSEKNHKEVMGGLHNIQLQLKDKKDRD